MCFDGALPYIIRGLAVGFIVQEQSAVIMKEGQIRHPAATLPRTSTMLTVRGCACLHASMLNLRSTQGNLHTVSLSAQKKHCEWVGDRLMHTKKCSRCC